MKLSKPLVIGVSCLAVSATLSLIGDMTAHASGVQCGIGVGTMIGGAGGIVGGAMTTPLAVGIPVMIGGGATITDGAIKTHDNCETNGQALPKNCAPAGAWAKHDYPYTSAVPATCH